jgi:catechol 2,3-dioxygenase-like lactoylglutathione lyase family enzyme
MAEDSFLAHRSLRMMRRLVGINHIALEVADIEAALAWYGRFFELEVDLSERDIGMAFIGMGDQFIALSEVAEPHRDAERHFGLVVDDKAAVRAELEAAGVELTPAPNCTFRDPWGNAVQVVDYRDIKFTKTDRVLQGMRLSFEKTQRALDELRSEGLAD